jgi:lipopolysaccharide biosynthesis glycosyltransferase
MKKAHVAFCIDNNYVNHLIVTIYSLLKNNPNEKIHVHVVASDLTTDSKAVIDALKEFHAALEISYHKADPAMISGLAMTMDYISSVTYYRLLLAEIIPKNIDTLLYLDADIAIHGKLSELFATDLGGAYAAGVPDIYLNEDAAYKQKISLKSGTYYNAGVLLLNLKKMRQSGVTKKLLANAKKKAHEYQDQDAINITFDSIVTLDRQYNYQIKDKQYDTLPGDAMAILHYSGSMKPWNRDRPYDQFSTIYDRYKLDAASFVAAHSKNVKYGLLKYSTDNVGDTIQGIAARKFLPRVDYYFERDNMDATKTSPGEVVKVIINGWWGDGPENWPPLDQNLEILPISMYAEDRIQAEFKKPRSKVVLNHFGPVGARSHGTEKFLKDNGIDSYFSGCMTLTLNPDKHIKKQDYILAVDVSDAVYEAMRKQTDRRIIRIGVLRDISTDINEQIRHGEFYLYLYQSAHAVVTTRLHTMLPSIALGTPVLFVKDILDHDDVRFSGLASLSHSARSKDYIKNPEIFNLNTPPKNKTDYLKIRKSLEKTCKEFTGYMSDQGFMTKPVSELLFDGAFLQAVVGGASKLGDIIEQRDVYKMKFEHKENHVNEIAAELDELRQKYDQVQSTFAWKVAKRLRSANGKSKKS